MSKYVVTSEWKTLYGIMALLSMVCSLTLPLLYYISRKTRQHPGQQWRYYYDDQIRILVCICVFEMIACYHLMIWAMDLFNFLQFFRVYEMIKYLTFFSDVSSAVENEVECQQNQIVYFSALYFEFNYNIILCIDLMITIKKPFISGKSRSKYYHSIVALISLIQLLFTISDIQHFCQKYSQSPSVYPELYIAYPTVIITEIMFYILGTISIVMGVQNYRQQNDNLIYKDIQKQYLINHIFIICILFLIWIVPFVNNLYLSISNTERELLNNISFTILLSQGIFLALIRLREPFFRLRLKTLILSVLGRARLKDLAEVSNQDGEANIDLVDQWNNSLASLISKYQNRGLVKCILQGVVSITQFKNEYRQSSSTVSPELIKQWLQEEKSHQFISDASSTILLEQSEHQLKTIKSGTFESPLLLTGSVDLQNKFKIKATEYAPKLFEMLRRFDGIDDETLCQSLMLSRNKEQIKQSQESLGKSGAFFFFSSDNLLILKTISPGELQCLMKYIMNGYVQHLSLSPQSLLSRIYGVYMVQIDGVAPVQLLLMENGNKHSLSCGSIRSIYDLKGSLVHRMVQSDDKGKVLKDINFMESDDIFIELEKHKHDLLLEQLKRDTHFLRECNLMDYSLLLTISEVESMPQEPVILCRGLQNKNILFSFCIIDYLQRFHLAKYLEYKYKTTIKNPGKKNLISCVTPEQYETRFNVFMNSIICPTINH